MIKAIVKVRKTGSKCTFKPTVFLSSTHLKLNTLLIVNSAFLKFVMLDKIFKILYETIRAQYPARFISEALDFRRVTSKPDLLYYICLWVICEAYRPIQYDTVSGNTGPACIVQVCEV